MSIFSKIFGDANEKYIKSLQPLVDKINSLEKEYEKSRSQSDRGSSTALQSGFSDEKLKQKTQEFKERLKNGETRNDL